MRLSSTILGLCSTLCRGACDAGSAVPCETASSAPSPASCCASDDDPTDVADRFMQAVRAGDSCAFADVVTEAAFEAVADGGFELNGSDLESFELGVASIDGDTARVPVECVEGGRPRTLDLLLRRDDDWRVFGLSIELGDTALTVDFEQMAELANTIGEGLAEGIGQEVQQAFDDAQHTWAQGGTPDEIAARRARFEALAAVTLDDVHRSWRVDVDGAGRPLRDVVAELVRGTGLELADDTPLSPVELELTGVSRAEAIERVAAAAGFHPIWPPAEATFDFEGEPEPLRFASGPRPCPATCVGPFLVEVVELAERAPHAVGTIELAVRALGLAPEVLAFQTESNEVLFVERVRSGATALTDEALHVWSSPSVRDGYFVYSIDRDLTGLLRSVERIDELTGEVRLPVPVAVESLSLRRGAGPWTCEVGELDASAWSSDVELLLEAPPVASDDSFASTKLRMSPLDASGAALGVRFESSSGWGRKLTGNLQCPEPPAALDVKICTTETLTAPFELGPIALEQHARQPERLAELEFDGGEPLAVEILDHQRSEHGDQVTLRATNRSNKDAVSIVVDFDYLDANGTKLDDFMHSLSGSWDFDTETFGPFVAAGATHETETHAAFVPAGTVKILARLRSVEFPDGTSWERTIGTR